MVTNAPTNTQRFTQRYYDKLYTPKHLRLPGKQLEANWASFLKAYVQNDTVRHFRERTIEDAINVEVARASSGKRRRMPAEEVRKEGRERGEAAFERALKTAYEIHSLGKGQIDVMAALGSEVHTEKGITELFTTSDSRLKRTLDALGERSQQVLNTLRYIEQDTSGIANIDYALSQNAEDRSAAFIRMIQLSLALQPQRDEREIDAFERVRQSYPNQILPKVANVARAYSYLFRFFYNINPQMSAVGHELGEFSVYCENPRGYLDLNQVRQEIADRQEKHIPELRQALVQLTRKLGWKVTGNQSKLFGGFADRKTVVTQERPYPKGMLELVDKAFSRPHKYINFDVAMKVLSEEREKYIKADDDATLSAIDYFEQAYNEIWDQTQAQMSRKSKPVNFTDLFYENLGMHLLSEAPERWYALEQVLRRHPQIASIIRTDKIDDVLGIRLIALPDEETHNSLHEALSTPDFTRIRIARQAAAALGRHRQTVGNFADSLVLKLIEHRFGPQIQVRDYQNRLGRTGFDSRFPTAAQDDRPHTLEETANMTSYNAAHIMVFVGGHPLEVQIMCRDDHHHQHTRWPGLTAVGYAYERLARIPVVAGEGFDPTSPARWLRIHNRIQYGLYSSEQARVAGSSAGKTVQQRMKEIESIISRTG